MSSQVIQTKEVNPFQKHLIPRESYYVGLLMQKAAVWSKEENFVVSRVVSASFAGVASLMSAVNTVSYVFLVPVHILRNVVTLNPIGLIKDFIEGLTNVVKSLVFTALGVTFVALGILIPKPLFSCFSPEYALTHEEALEKKCNSLEKEVIELRKGNKRLSQRSLVHEGKIVSLEQEKMDLEKQLKAKSSSWNPFW